MIELAAQDSTVRILLNSPSSLMAMSRSEIVGRGTASGAAVIGARRFAAGRVEAPLPAAPDA